MTHRTVEWFEEACADTATYHAERGLEYVVLGLCGEAGELANKYKKTIRDDDGKLSRERRLALMDEAGDVAWYLARLAFELGTNLDEVMRANVEKLQSRKRRGVLHGSGDAR